MGLTRPNRFADDLGDDVDYILDGGSCDIGLESTIVDCSVDPPQILRPGGIATEDVAAVVQKLAATSGPSRAPGMLSSHYAPRCRVILVEPGTPPGERSTGRTRTLDANADPIIFAREMYTELRRADQDGIDTVVIELPPARGIGTAIRDRLSKAAANR